MASEIEIIPDKYYVITHKEKFNSVLIEGVYLLRGPSHPGGPITNRYYLRDATPQEVILYAKKAHASKVNDFKFFKNS